MPLSTLDGRCNSSQARTTLKRRSPVVMLREALARYHQMGVPVRRTHARQVAQVLGCDLTDLDTDLDTDTA